MRTILIAALAAPALMLGGCGTLNRGVDSIKQPVVSRTDYVFDAQSTMAGLAPGEADRVAGWLATMKLRYGDQVSVDDPNPYGSRARAEIAEIVTGYGLRLSDRAPITSAPMAAGMVRVVLSRATATVPGCPDFTRSGSSEFEGSATSNFGCASNASLAAMVANPLDLVRGQADPNTTDPITSARAINNYRKAAPTGNGGTTTKSESTGGK
ncbi:MAG TPA: CpaD family pilus assembly lipoprotein [Sphingomonas sp.]